MATESIRGRKLLFKIAIANDHFDTIGTLAFAYIPITGHEFYVYVPIIIEIKTPMLNKGVVVCNF